MTRKIGLEQTGIITQFRTLRVSQKERNCEIAPQNRPARQ